MSKRSLWPGVRSKTAKGRRYWYWTRVEKGAAWIRLPDPHADADAFMRKLAHLQRVSLRIETQRREGTFASLVDQYRRIELPRWAASTQRHYNFYLDRLVLGFGEALLSELTPEDIQARVMDANLDTPGSADFMLGLLRNLYRFAKKRPGGRKLEDWTAGVEKYGHKREYEPWPQHVLDAALASKDDLFRLAVALHLYTGQRTGDACAMTWNAITPDGIPVRQEKTGATLTIPLHPTLAAELARATRSAIVILTNRRGASLKPDAFRKWCIEFAEPFGVRVTPHGLRKNATNELFEAGCTAAQVASVTGHKSLAMLEHYGKRRSQASLAKVAIAERWAAETERKRENSRTKGKPAPKKG